jgi:hypothetical protein
MRRSLRLGLWALALLLLVVLGGYTAFWFIAAGRVEGGLGQWAQSLRDHNHLDLTWKRVAVGGFPFGFRIGLDEARLRNLASGGGEVQMPVLMASARPGDFRVWRLRAPDGLTASAGPAGKPSMTLTARAASGSVAVGADGGARIWFALARPAAEFGIHLAADHADIWLNLPPQQPQSHVETAFGLAVAATQVSLPQVPAPFTNPLDEIDFAVTIKGPLSPGPLRQAATAWRDAGGTLELDQLTLRWGGLKVRGSGTVALDRELQPEGAFSGAVEGYGQLMQALVAAHRMRASDAQLAQLALTMLARSGPDGKPEIATSFTIQDGQMFLGPARLGPAPHIDWQ